MPLVFAENELTESGIEYEDHTGISYEFPKMYRGLIQPGERFVYYRGRKRKGNARAPQVYFGTGVVGKTVKGSRNNGRLVCEIIDFKRFVAPVPFKRSKTDYLEIGGKRRGYFQRGVRRITESEYKDIVDSAANLTA